MNVLGKPPDGTGIWEFNQEYFRHAPLICHTPSFAQNNMSFGFMAENVFYKTNEFNGSDSDWLHDEKTLQLQQSLYGGPAEHMLITKFKYESFYRLNLEIQEYIDGDECDLWLCENGYLVTVTFVTTFNPIFCSRTFNPNACERFCYQKYRSAVDSFWKDLIEANAFQIVYKMTKSEFNSWMKQLYELLPCSITFTKIISKPYSAPNKAKLDSLIHRWPEDTKYLIACIQSLGAVGHYFLNYRLFHQNDITLISYADGRCDSTSADTFLISLYYFLKRDIALSSLDFNPSHLYTKRQRLGPQYVWIKNATVTPTTIRYEPGEYAIDCRGFRKLGSDNILQVKFRDEDLSEFPRDENCLKTAMFVPLIEGLTVGGRTYYDFGTSCSLFRENGAYFLAVNDKSEITEVIKKWAKFKEEPAAKVAARLGQFFTSAKEIQSKLRYEEIGVVKDYKTTNAQGQYIFSDGIGMLDPKYARVIAAELDLPNPISSIQIRCLGFKGMMTVNPYSSNLVSSGGPFKAIFRKSQNKFKDFSSKGAIDFDIAQFSGPAPLKLHRPFIALLVSLARDQGKLDIVERRLHELLTQSIMDILRPLYDQKAFVKVLEKLPKYFPVAKMASKNLINQPFLRALVEAHAVYVAKLLKDKCQIALPETLGRSALGVLDDSGLLQPGQIFFRYSNDMHPKSSDKSKTILVGPVGVTKSPLYHQGDLRFLTAVDIPELYHLVDVVVFPKFGERPIPDEIGGGDLDGDTYCVWWDKDLLLEHSPAADFTAADTSNIPNVTVDQLHHEHAKFRVEYTKNNNLQQLSNVHLAHLVLHDPNSSDVETIAQKADVAVNYFKSGLKAPDLSREEKPVFFPSFMNKRHEPAFKSDHILCQLHDRSTLIYSLLQLAQESATAQRMSVPKKVIKVDEFAEELYKSYSTEIRNLMKDYGVKSEAQLFSNLILQLPGVFNMYKHSMRNEDSVMSAIQASTFEIFGRYRKKILNKFYPKWKEDMLARNENVFSYMMPFVSNEMKKLAQMFSDLAEYDGILSFPWICFEGLDLDSPDLTANVRSQLDVMLNKHFVAVQGVKRMPLEYQQRYTSYEMVLIQLAFTCGLLNIPNVKLHDSIISNPAFVISIPAVHSQDFEENYQNLKLFSGCQDIAIRLRRNKGNYHHFSIMCSGTLYSCRKLEDLLTPFLAYNHQQNISLAEMKTVKTQSMQKVLENLFGFIPPPPSSLPHSRSGRIVSSRSSRRQDSTNDNTRFPFARMNSN